MSGTRPRLWTVHGRTEPGNGSTGSSLTAALQMIIVAGGQDINDEYLASSEVYQYPDGLSWSSVANLPSPRTVLRGASLGGTFVLVGGFNNQVRFDDVLSYEPISDSYTVIGHLTEARYYHGVTEVPWQAVAQYCSTGTAQQNIPKL